MTNHPSTLAAQSRAAESAAALTSLTGVERHDIAVVLGSGWVPAADLLGTTVADLAVTDLPHFAPPAVEGHAGRVRSIDAGGRRVLVFLGRTHLYEERGVDAVTHAVRTAAATGCTTMVLTNGCGGLNPAWSPGTPVLISDHINLTGASPLHGAHFVDLTDLYSARLRELCRQIEPSLPEGVYAQFHGPMYETPAEIAMVRNIGGTLVGMSTALEAIVARSLGMEILGLSLVTNLAAGMSGKALNHVEVLEAGQAAAARMGDLLARVLREVEAVVVDGGIRAHGAAGDLARAQAWVHEDPDDRTRTELRGTIDAARAHDPAALADLADAFGSRLEFGTAGLRGRLGPGSNRMNRVVVIQTAAGLAAYLRERGGGAVVIGFDARHNSDVFARDSAMVFAGAGLTPLVLPRPLPTPVLAHAVRHLGCAAGVMVTASHNPAQDNGYKVYLGEGSQIVPPADAEISAFIASVAGQPLSSILLSDDWTTLGDDVLDDYVAQVATLVGRHSPRQARVVYTPLHGVGGETFERTLDAAGFPPAIRVDAQFEPDPDFPTLAFPNPEEPGAIDLAIAEAKRASADLVIANDPDADRCAVAVALQGPQGANGLQGSTGEWRMLTGDEVGSLLGWWMIKRGATSGVFARSLVSSSMLDAIAGAHGLACTQTLTGFKWIARVPALEYGYEEALGYCVDPLHVRDKDGISAALLIIEMASALKEDGRSLADVLDDLDREHGIHATSQVSVRVSDLGRITDIMDRLRANPPSSVAGIAVLGMDDLEAPTDGLPPTDGLRFRLEGGARIIVRPSGTEPKIKCYLEVIEYPNGTELEGARASASRRMEALRLAVAPWLE